MERGLLSRFVPLPAPFDAAVVERALADLRNISPRLALRFDSDSMARNLLSAIFGGSPFLRELILKEPAWTEAYLDADPSVELNALCSFIVERGRHLTAEDALMREVRILRTKAALLVALADLAGRMSIEEVTQSLTLVADAIVGACVDFLLLEASRAGKLAGLDSAEPGKNSGYVVLAMGKHGAFELNYSSDIDLIVLYDASFGKLAAAIEPATFFVRMTKRLVSLLQDVTEDGYAFRADLRLRPDPRATQIAIGIEAAAIYYENMGQNWERAAMIKARPCAGDLALGQEFLNRLSSYVWRKYLDFAAIADVQSLKRQIHAVKGHGEIAVRGHNVKLGRGGIREIEFFVQTQQLIAGGRNPALRGRKTVEMLDALAAAGWIDTDTAADLKLRYRFLRQIEHRIQMVADQQTHILPKEDGEFSRLSRFAGFAGALEFETALRTTFESVQRHYARLFEKAPALGGEQGSLVFTGSDDDPNTLNTLRRMGFREASEVSAIIRGWHFGRYPATRSARAKEILTEIMPVLLQALASTGDADAAFLAFDRFLSGLSSGVQIFSMLKANLELLELLARILGVAPRLAEELARRPKVLDVVLDRGPGGALPARSELERITTELVSSDLSFESALDRARIIGREQMFRVGVSVLSGRAASHEAGLAFSEIADVMIGRLLDVTRREISTRYGDIAGDSLAVIALGKLGGRETTAASDLDLMLIYDYPRGREVSSGKKPLSALQYYTRLTQRLIAAISSPTGEGILYPVDMRLRPSGNKGPVATHIDSFIQYHRGSAWTWEKLALTRARVVAGDESFKSRVESAILEALRQPRDEKTTRTDAVEMRLRMADEIGSSGIWDLKFQRGGLVDIEFIAQYLQVANAFARPALLRQNTEEALEAARNGGILDASDFETLRGACRLYQDLTQLLRLCVGKNFSLAMAPTGLGRLLAAAAETPDLATAEALIAERQTQVRHVFERILGAE